MTDQQKPLELSFARQHEIIQVPLPGGRVGPLYVMGRCDSPEIAYYDEVSRHSYPNIQSLIADLGNGGRFHLAARCSKHRWTETIPEETREILRAAGGLS